MAMILSIVVPVYNVKQYLDKCVSSLLNQDLDKEDYEIILVDDGSTDGSGELCDVIAARETDIKVVHQPNQGLSCARNTGMSIAQGKYIQFVDSDDFLEENVLGFLVRRMELLKLQVMRFGCRRVKEGDDMGAVSTKKEGVVESIGKVMDGPSFLINELWYTCYACQFVFLRSLLVDYNLVFKPGILFEDVEWTPRVLQATSRICSVDRVVYNYLERAGSITTGSSKKRISASLHLIDELKSQMCDAEDKRWYQGMISHIVVGIVTSIARKFYDERKVFLNILNDLNIYPLSEFRAKKKGLRKIRMINVSPRLACFLIHIRSVSDKDKDGVDNLS